MRREAPIDAAQIVRRNPVFDPRARPGFTADHYLLWNRIGADTTVAELVTGSGLGDARAIGLLQQLQALGAIDFIVDETDEIDVTDQTELANPTFDEQRLLAEQVDLADWEKRRILSVVRVLRDGNYFEFLGVPPAATKQDLKRAYHALSKEFHPDRYFSRKLGSYHALLDYIFRQASHAVKVLTDARTVTPRALKEPNTRRRNTERFPYVARVRMRCSSWPQVAELATEDVGAAGLFVPTDERAEPGDRVELELTLPNGATLMLHGTVRSWLSPEIARKHHRRAGIGIMLDRPTDAQRERFRNLLDAARRATPTPAEATPRPEPEGAPMPRVRIARGTGRHQRPSPILGIDFGTSYTSASAIVDNRVRILELTGGARAIPSVVCFPERGKHLVGEPARERLLRDPMHTIPAAKRLLGRAADDPTLAQHLARSGYQTQTAPDGSVIVDMWGEPYAVAQICGLVLREVREAAERTLGQDVSRAVVTVPVSFDDHRIELIHRAGRLAQLDVVEVIDEPSAAALANRFRPDFGGIVGVFDFGGGTFDFSVIDARGGDFRVLATAGDSWLGGDDLDYAMAEAVANLWERTHGMDLRKRVVEWQQLLASCEHAKRSLSTANQAFVRVPEVMHTANGPVNLEVRVGREPAERLWHPAIDRAIATCEQALALLGMRPQHLSAVYLSGGTSYIPAVRNHLFQRFRLPVRAGVPPEYAACLGAGVHAAQLERRMETTLAPARG